MNRESSNNDRILAPFQPKRFSLNPNREIQLSTGSGKCFATLRAYPEGIIIEGEGNHKKVLHGLAWFTIGINELGKEFFGDIGEFVSGDHLDIVIKKIHGGELEIELTDRNSTNGTLCEEITTKNSESGERPTWPSVIPDEPVVDKTQNIVRLKAIEDNSSNYTDIVAGGRFGESVSMNGKCRAFTHIGGRGNNEDGSLVTNNAVGVADGVGGNSSGEIASRIALETVEKHINNNDDKLVKIFERACDALHERNPNSDCGTTLALARKKTLDDGRTVYEVAHVGDTRINAFSLKHRTKVYESRDQSFVQRQLEAKTLEPIERYTSQNKSIISNSISAKGMKLNPVFHTIDWEDGDLVVLLYSDGISDYVSDYEARKLYFKLYDEDPTTASEKFPNALVELALSRQKRPDGFDIEIENPATKKIEKHPIIIKGDGGDNATVGILQ